MIIQPSSIIGILLLNDNMYKTITVFKLPKIALFDPLGKRRLKSPEQMPLFGNGKTKGKKRKKK